MESIENEAPVTRRDIRKQDRRQAIVEAARASFLEHGYSGTSMSGLLKTLGGSKATLWSYFRSKDELFAAVVEEISGTFRAQLELVLSTDQDLETALFDFCRTFLEKITSPDGLATWRLVVAESGRFPEVGKIFYERAASHPQAALRAFFARQIASGKLIAEDPATMAETLTSLCIGLHTRQIWGLGRPSVAERDEKARSFARWFLKAYGRLE
jgi:AcrR family transcriptional regulator